MFRAGFLERTLQVSLPMSTLKNEVVMNPMNENTHTGATESPAAIKSFSQLDRLKPVLRVVPRDELPASKVPVSETPASEPAVSEPLQEATKEVPVVLLAASASKPTEAQIALSEAQTRTDVLVIKSPSTLEKWKDAVLASAGQLTRLQLGIAFSLVFLSFSIGYFMSRQPMVSKPKVPVAARPVAKIASPKKVKLSKPASVARKAAKRAPAAKQQKPIGKRAKGRANSR
jgi:hypothetical protein